MWATIMALAAYMPSILDDIILIEFDKIFSEDPISINIQVV